MHTRRERLIVFAAFALAIGAAMAHEYQIPAYCLRLITHVTAR